MANAEEASFDDQFAILSKIFDKDLVKNDFDILTIPRWLEPIYYILFPAFIVSGMFTNTGFANLDFYFILGLAGYFGLRHSRKTNPPASRESFNEAKNPQERSTPTTSPKNNPDSGSNVALSDHEESAWDKIINEFRKPKE